MKYIVNDLIIDVLPRSAKRKGERVKISADSPMPCACTPQHPTCWCTCGGCTTLTHPSTADFAAKISKFKDLEKKLVQGIKEVRRRQAMLKAAKSRLKKKTSKSK
jgi:hypothetical protein